MIMSYPSGPARYDCTGPEWMELFRSRRQAEEIWTKIQKVQGWIRNKFACFFYFSY